MAFWPKSTMRDNPRHPCVSKDSETVLLTDDEHIIDYNRPLMTCLETIKHNERYRVKKPAGNSNTISVPLMTYSSSLEQGTIFSAPDPNNIDFSKLPKLDFLYKSPAQEKPVNVQKKSLQDVTRNTKKEVFYGLGTVICVNKAVKKGSKSNETTITSHNNKESKCEINSIHSILSKPQFDKLRVFRQYNPVKKSKDPKVYNSGVLEQNASNLETPMATIITTKPLESDSTIGGDSVNLLPESGMEDWNIDGISNTEVIFEPEDSNYFQESPDALVAHINLEDNDLPLPQYTCTVQKDEDQRNSTPIALIDLTLPLLNCTEILDINE